MKIVIALNSAWNLVNFRSGLIQALVSQGHEVVAVAPSDAYASKLPALGCRYVPLAMDSVGTHPIRDLQLLIRFYRLLKAERPDVFLGFTVKPNVYGSLAAHALGIPVINNIAGLGSVFMKNNWLARLVKGLYRLALSRSRIVFFQNCDDRQMFVSARIVREGISDQLPGSGVDLTRFTVQPLPNRSTLRFLMIARMLWDKGVAEFVAAARILKSAGVSAEFCLLGFVDESNTASVSHRQINEWVQEGSVRYLGVSDNVQNEISEADCVVLPSYYREGTPRTLLEAAAMARPIVTTDAVGCRDVVDDGVNGYLVSPRNASDLADKMHRISKLSAEALVYMGLQGRKKVEKEFDERIVIEKYVNAITRISLE